MASAVSTCVSSTQIPDRPLKSFSGSPMEYAYIRTQFSQTLYTAFGSKLSSSPTSLVSLQLLVFLVSQILVITLTWSQTRNTQGLEELSVSSGVRGCRV